MELEVARQILTATLAYSKRIEESIKRAKEHCDEDTFRSYRRFAARAMGYMFTEVIGPIYEQHPELAPEWFTSNPTGDAKGQVMDKALRESFLAMMDEVDEGVASMTALVDQACSMDEANKYHRRLDDVRASIADLKAYLDGVGLK